MPADHDIASIEVQERRLGLVAPLQTAAGLVRGRQILLFVVHGNDGVTGIGEAAPLPWAGTEDLHASRRALDRARSALLDGRPPDLASTPAASAAVELALLDLASNRAGRPLCQLLGPQPVATVGVNALLGGQTRSALADSARAAVQAGFATLKLKVGSLPLAEDLARVAAVASIAGRTARLRLDANGAWGLEQAQRALDAFAAHDVELIEQPVPAGPSDVALLARLRATSQVPIAADESATSPARVGALVDAGAIDAVILKPMRLGGLRPALLCARLAQGAGVAVVVTSFLGSAVERTAALHLAAVIDSTGLGARDHGLATAAWLSTDVGGSPPVVHGRMCVPSTPGLGVTLSPSSP